MAKEVKLWNRHFQCHDCVKCYLAFHKTGGDAPIQHCSMTKKSTAWERASLTVREESEYFGQNCGPDAQFFERTDYAK